MSEAFSQSNAVKLQKANAVVARVEVDNLRSRNGQRQTWTSVGGCRRVHLHPWVQEKWKE